MSDNTGNAKLFSKMAQVMSRVRTVEKTGRNQFDKYDYVTADAIATRIGSVMSEVGLAFFPSMVNVETSEYTTQKGGSNFRTVAHFQMTLACTETGATWTSMWSGEAIDRSDKSISKAAASATKYFLLKTFLLAGGDEEDADASSPVVEGKRQGAQKPATPPQTDVDFGMGSTDADMELLKLLDHLNMLGEDVYGAQWEQVREHNVKRVSGGKATSSDKLTPEQLQKLIAGMEKVREKRAQPAIAVVA